MPSARTRIHLVVLAAIAVTAVVPPSEGARRESRLAEWIDGPVRYIATPAERKAFRTLTEDAQRIAFVESFWAQRDPTPDTLVNETRQSFWRRVREANTLFLDAPEPGWRTDRGRVHILYGPPNQIEEDLDADTGSDLGSRGLIRWFYSGRPEGRPDARPLTVVPFVRGPGGEWRLSSDPKLASMFYNRFADRPSRWERWVEQNLHPYGSELAVMLDQGQMLEVPPQETVLLESVTTAESFRTVPLPTSVQRYVHPARDGALVVLTVSVPEPPDASMPALMARFVSDDATRVPVVIAEGSFRPRGAGALRIAQARAVLSPGRWSLLVLAADASLGATGLHRQTIEVPPPSAELRLSDVTLAREFAPLPYASLVSYDEAYVLGSFAAVPRVVPELTAGEELTLFYEIYGGTPPYRVTYRLEGREADGRWVALGQPQVLEEATGAQGWSLASSATWPAAEYRVEVEVSDRAGASARAVVPLTLRAPAR